MAEKSKKANLRLKTKGGKAVNKAASSRKKATKAGTPGTTKSSAGRARQSGSTRPKSAQSANGKDGKQAAGSGQKVKRKPPSITITRPEVTRPPIVPLPEPKLEAPIGAPSLLLPKGGNPISTLTPILRWMYVGGATRYEVELSHDSHFGRGHSASIVSLQTAISLDPSQALQPGLVYVWRVRGGNDAGWGPWSGAESFKAPDKG